MLVIVSGLSSIETTADWYGEIPISDGSACRRWTTTTGMCRAISRSRSARPTTWWNLRHRHRDIYVVQHIRHRAARERLRPSANRHELTPFPTTAPTRAPIVAATIAIDGITCTDDFDATVLDIALDSHPHRRELHRSHVHRHFGRNRNRGGRHRVRVVCHLECLAYDSLSRTWSVCVTLRLTMAPSIPRSRTPSRGAASEALEDRAAPPARHVGRHCRRVPVSTRAWTSADGRRRSRRRQPRRRTAPTAGWRSSVLGEEDVKRRRDDMQTLDHHPRAGVRFAAVPVCHCQDGTECYTEVQGARPRFPVAARVGNWYARRRDRDGL